MESFRRAIEINPFAVPDAYNGLGLCFERLGRYEEAMAQYQRSLEVEKDHPYAQENLERCAGKTSGEAA